MSGWRKKVLLTLSKAHQHQHQQQNQQVLRQQSLRQPEQPAQPVHGGGTSPPPEPSCEAELKGRSAQSSHRKSSPWQSAASPSPPKPLVPPTRPTLPASPAPRPHSVDDAVVCGKKTAPGRRLRPIPCWMPVHSSGERQGFRSRFGRAGFPWRTSEIDSLD